MGHINIMVSMLFFLTVVVISNSAMKCYQGPSLFSVRCNGNCIYSNCNNGQYVRGCAGSSPSSDDKEINKQCSSVGSTFKSGSLKYCNCDECNHEHLFKCQVTVTDKGDDKGSSNEGDDKGSASEGGAIAHVGLLFLAVSIGIGISQWM